MKREEMTELIKTRKVHDEEDVVTLGRKHDIAFPHDYGGVISVEYKPDDYRLTEDAFDGLAEEGFFDPFYENLGDEPRAEKMVSELYWALVDVLYPQSSYLDEPWNRLPLVVEVEYGRDEVSDYYCSLGTYR